MKTVNACIPDPFELTPTTTSWLTENYPNLHITKTRDAFAEWATNATDNNKRSATYGKPLECRSWQLKFRNVIRIAMANKWSGICVAKSGYEVDVRWAETLTHAKAIGCPLVRREVPPESVEAFRTRVKNWEAHDQPRIDFGNILRKA